MWSCLGNFGDHHKIGAIGPTFPQTIRPAIWLEFKTWTARRHGSSMFKDDLLGCGNDSLDLIREAAFHSAGINRSGHVEVGASSDH